MAAATLGLSSSLDASTWIAPTLMSSAGKRLGTRRWRSHRPRPPSRTAPVRCQSDCA
jgi:hypothetical protein